MGNQLCVQTASLTMRTWDRYLKRFPALPWHLIFIGSAPRGVRHSFQQFMGHRPSMALCCILVVIADVSNLLHIQGASTLCWSARPSEWMEIRHEFAALRTACAPEPASVCVGLRRTAAAHTL
jgi:hypothetical protein